MEVGEDEDKSFQRWENDGNQSGPMMLYVYPCRRSKSRDAMER